MPDIYCPETSLDVYKLGHGPLYPDHTSRVYSNWTPRGSRVEGQTQVAFFSQQYFLQRYMMDAYEENFFNLPFHVIEARYKRRLRRMLGVQDANVGHLADLHDLGYVPLRFSCLDEGTLSPLRVPQFVVENTLDAFWWLTNSIETLNSCTIWQPCTTATTAHRFRTRMNHYGALTGVDPAAIGYQGHDFSMRGMAGMDAAAASSAAFLLSFLGSDTCPVMDFVEYYYGSEEVNDDAYAIGQSVYATEHSVQCAGLQDWELETISRHMDIHPTGILAEVIDTWNLWHVLTYILPKLKDQIMARDGKLVVRPDSGYPPHILCGNPDARFGTPESKGVIRLLDEVFGHTVNAAGYKVLDSHIGAIYGEAITDERSVEIMQRLMAMGYQSDSSIQGLGSYAFQHVTRDTYGNAMKATWAEVEGEGRDLMKRPITDVGGEKFSACGRLAVQVWEDTGELYVIEHATPEQEAASLLRPRWEDGKFLDRTNYARVRERLWSGQPELLSA